MYEINSLCHIVSPPNDWILSTKGSVFHLPLSVASLWREYFLCIARNMVFAQILFACSSLCIDLCVLVGLRSAIHWSPWRIWNARRQFLLLSVHGPLVYRSPATLWQFFCRIGLCIWLRETNYYYFQRHCESKDAVALLFQPSQQCCFQHYPRYRITKTWKVLPVRFPLQKPFSLSSNLSSHTRMFVFQLSMKQRWVLAHSSILIPVNALSCGIPTFVYMEYKPFWPEDTN